MRNKGYTYRIDSKPFLEEGNSELKGYFSGIIAADGHVREVTDGQKVYLVVLSLIDKQIIEDLKTKLGDETSLRSVNRKKWNKNASDQYVLGFRSKPIFNFLESRGITCDKSKELSLSRIPDVEFFHFLRGYIDGDGSFNPRGILIYSSNYKFLNEVELKLQPYGVWSNSGIYKRENSSLYGIFYPIESSKRLIPLLYKDSTLFLKRKQEKFYPLLSKSGRLFKNLN